MASRQPKQPTKFTPHRRKRFLEAVLVGASVAGASGYAGWSQSAGYSYLRKGREVLTALADGPREELHSSDRDLAEFVENYENAESAAEVQLLRNVHKAGAHDWRATAWVMERRWPERYARTRRSDAQKRREEADADKAEAFARLTEVRATQAQESRSNEGGAKLMVPEDLFEFVARTDPEMFERLEEILTAGGVQVLSRGDLGGGVTRAELEAASPSPIPEGV